MTIDVQRDDMPGRHPCDLLAAEMEAFYRTRSDIRFDVALSIRLIRPRAVTIQFVRTLNKGRQNGSAVLDMMVRLADAHGVTLDLTAIVVPETRPAEQGLPQADLERFYARRGFVILDRSESGTRMIRTMRTIHLARATARAEPSPNRR